MPLRDKIKQFLGRDPEKDYLGRPRAGPELPKEIQDEFGNVRFEYGDFVEVRGDQVGPAGDHGAYALANVSKTFKLTRSNLLPQDPNDPRSVFFPDGTFGIVKSGGSATLDPRTQEPAWSIEIAMPDGSSGGLWLIRAADLRTSKPSDFRRRPAALKDLSMHHQDPFLLRIAELHGAFAQPSVRISGFDLIASQARIDAIKKKFSKLPGEIIDKLADVDPSGDAHSNLEWMTKTFYNAYKVQEKGKDRTKPKHGDFIIVPAAEDNRLGVFEVRFDGNVLVGKFGSRENINVAPPAMGFVSPRDLPVEPSSFYPGTSVSLLSPESLLPEREEQVAQGAFEAAKSAAEKFTGAWVWEGEGEAATPVWKNEVDYDQLVGDLNETIYDFEQTKKFVTAPGSTLKDVEGIKTDLNAFGSLKELQDYNASTIANHLQDRLIQGAEKYELIYEDDNWRVFDVKNKQASCMLAVQGFPDTRLRYLNMEDRAKWCVSRWEGTFWEHPGYTGNPDNKNWRMVQFHSKDGSGRKYLVYSRDGEAITEIKNWGNNSPSRKTIEEMRDVLEAAGFQSITVSSFGNDEGDRPPNALVQRDVNDAANDVLVTAYLLYEEGRDEPFQCYRNLDRAIQDADNDRGLEVRGYFIESVEVPQAVIDQYGYDQHEVQQAGVNAQVVHRYEPTYQDRYVIASAKRATPLHKYDYSDLEDAIEGAQGLIDDAEPEIGPEGELPDPSESQAAFEGVVIFKVSVPEPVSRTIDNWDYHGWSSWRDLSYGYERGQNRYDALEKVWESPPPREDFDIDLYAANISTLEWGRETFRANERGLEYLREKASELPRHVVIKHRRCPMSSVPEIVEGYGRGYDSTKFKGIEANSPNTTAVIAQVWTTSARTLCKAIPRDYLNEAARRLETQPEEFVHNYTKDSILGWRIIEAEVPEKLLRSKLKGEFVDLDKEAAQLIRLVHVFSQSFKEGVPSPSKLSKAPPGWFTSVPARPGDWGAPRWRETHEEADYPFGGWIYTRDLQVGDYIDYDDTKRLPPGTQIRGFGGRVYTAPVPADLPVGNYAIVSLPTAAQPEPALLEEGGEDGSRTASARRHYASAWPTRRPRF